MTDTSTLRILEPARGVFAYYDGRGVLERIDAMADIDVVRDGLAAIVQRVAA